MYPAHFGIFFLAALLTLPAYFINRFLIRKIKPRESGKNLLLYFLLVIAGVFVYITAGVYLVVTVAKWINKH